MSDHLDKAVELLQEAVMEDSELKVRAAEAYLRVAELSVRLADPRIARFMDMQERRG